jgi:hypothetical protein
MPTFFVFKFEVAGVQEVLAILLKENILTLRDMMRMLPSVIVSCISQEMVKFVSGEQFTLEDESDLKSFIEWIKYKTDALNKCCICFKGDSLSTSFLCPERVNQSPQRITQTP